MLKKFLKNESSRSMVEYGLILALIAVIVIVALTTLGGKVNGIFSGATVNTNAISSGI